MSAIPRRASRTHDYSTQNDIEDDVPDSYYDTRMPTSTRRYVDTRGNKVIEQGNKRLVIHEQPPPKKNVHWLLYIGVGMIFMLALYVGFQMFGNWWTEHQLDGTYGFPRTYQTDAVVYSGDSASHPSHYIFLNLNGTIQVVEFPHGDSTHARIYKGPTLFSDGADLVPVTGEFKAVGGKEEMIVRVGDQTFIYINDGTQFKLQQ